GMCGALMGRHLYFVGGPLCVEHGWFNDPPMHQDCAEFALKACAHLNRSKGRYNEALPLPADAAMVVAGAQSSNVKAEWFALMHTRDFRWERRADRMIYIHAELPWLDVQRWRDGAPMEGND